MTSVRSYTAALIACLLAACKPTPTIVSPGVPPELKHSWEVSFNRGDAAAVAALYEPDARLLMSGSAPVIGRANIQKAVADMIAARLQAKIDAEQNLASGDLAYVFGSYRVLHAHNGTEAERGSFVEVWRRRKGAWAISVDINAAAPAAAN